MRIAVAELRGGLGNQLFQVCAALAARHLGFDVRLDDGPLRRDHKRSLAVEGLARELGIPLGAHPEHRWWLRRKAPTVIADPAGSFGRVGDQLQMVTGNVILRGYFQDNANVAPHIEELAGAVARAAGERRKAPDSSVAVHVRRGDYIAESITSAFHGNLDFDYYENALRLLAEKGEVDSAVVYSDDVDYVAKHFAPELERRLSGLRVEVRDHPKVDPLAEMEYLAGHDTHVIANSTFSWWIATLSQSTSVVGPRRWWASPAAPDANGLRWPEWTWI